MAMKKFAILLITVSMFFGCSANNPTKSRGKQSDAMQDKLVVYGAFKADLAGNITWERDGLCDRSAFKFYARQQKEIDKLVDIIMKEKCTQEPGTLNKKCSCKYSGIGLKYTQLDVNEAVLWNSASSFVPTTSLGDSDPQKVDSTIYPVKNIPIP
jgi:hypothetical protein